MKNFFILCRDKNCYFAFCLTAGLLILAVVYLFFVGSVLPPEVPLFYSRPWGDGQLANPLLLWLLPFGTSLIIFFNFYLGSRLLTEFPFLTQILIWSNVLLALLSSVTVIKIANLIT